MGFVRELTLYIRKGFLISFVIITCVAVSVMIASLTSLIVHQAKLDKENYDEVFNDGKFYGLGDRLTGEIEEVFLKKENPISILENMNSWLHENGRFKYLEGREDTSSIIDKNSDSEFKDTYNEVMQTYWVGPEDIEHFGLTVCKGNMFEKNSFVHKENMTNDLGQYCEAELPILLGYKYQTKYKLGDNIEMYNAFFVGKAKVIGFLEKNTNVVDSNGNIVVLDDKFVLPMFNRFSGKESKVYLRCFYFQKNNGKLYSKISADELQDLINEYTSYLGIPGGYLIFGASNQWQAVFADDLTDKISNLKMIAIGITMFSAVALSIYIMVKIKRSTRYFAIMVINGFSKSQVRLMVISEVLIIILISSLLGVLLSKIIHNSSFPEYDITYLKGIIPLFIVGVVGIAAGIFTVERQEIAKMIGREE